MATADICADSSLNAKPLGILPGDLLMRLHAQHPERYPVLLESPAQGNQAQGYDLLFAFPGQRLEYRQGDNGCFLTALDVWWQQERLPASGQSLPFSGGWFLYLGYELAQQIEPRLSLHALPRALVAQAVRMPAALLRNCATSELWWVNEPDAGAAERLTQLQADLQAVRQPAHSLAPLSVSMQEDPAETFLHAAERVLEHIAAGDIYQANLSRGWRGSVAEHGAALLYAQLKRANPAPFAGLARLSADHHVISSSPERLIEVRDGWASTRPIAGTRPRHADPAADQALLDELHAHPKERAEHIMLLDLERNDLGKVCVGGSVEVDEYMAIESYAHVHHIVSNVRGRVREGVTPGQIISAVFPGGTITGVPKVRCMQIIAELEGTARGAYTGSMGYLNRDGSMDLNILIRTLELQGTQLICRAGAGIVADSNPQRELEETRAKALGLLRATRSDMGSA